MKNLDIPQSGKRGLVVSQGGRYGQISLPWSSPPTHACPHERCLRAYREPWSFPGRSLKTSGPGSVTRLGRELSSSKL
jgi:hypothetical protein